MSHSSEDDGVQKSELEKMSAKNIIESARNEWAALIVFAAKKDEKLRFCVNDRKFNDVTKRYFYLVLCMDMCIDSTGGAPVFFALDRCKLLLLAS